MFEAELWKRLISQDPNTSVGEWIESEWLQGGLNTEDKKAAALYLARSKSTKLLFDLTLKDFAAGKDLIWSALIEAFHDLDRTPASSTWKAFVEGATAQKKLEDLVSSLGLDSSFLAVQQLREKLQPARFKELEIKRDAEFEKLKSLRRDRLVENEKKLLHSMRRKYPTEKSLLLRWNEIRELEARAQIDKSKARSGRMKGPVQMDDRVDVSPMPPELVQRIKEVIRRSPETAYDLAISALMMGDPETALTLLEGQNPFTMEAAWIRFECLMQLRRFLECLGEVKTLEVKVTADPEAIYGCSYYRARSLWGLGEKLKAIEELEMIVKLRPDYRSAHSLLIQWRGTIS